MHTDTQTQTRTDRQTHTHRHFEHMHIGVKKAFVSNEMIAKIDHSCNEDLPLPSVSFFGKTYKSYDSP